MSISKISISINNKIITIIHPFLLETIVSKIKNLFNITNFSKIKTYFHYLISLYVNH